MGKSEENMGTDNGKKIPSNYFLYPEIMAFVLLPVTWGLLPIAGFFPKALSPFLPVIFLWISPIDTLIKFQGIFAITFKAIVVIHCFELIYATYRCLVLGLNFPTTVKWLISVSLNGVFALKMLHEPEKFYNIGEKKSYKNIE